MRYDYTFKVLLLGDSSSGKVEFLNRYISGFFLDDLRLTTGVDFYSKTTNFNGKKIKLQLWIFGGEERFRFLLNNHFKGANGAIIMYDITNLKSLEYLPERTQALREHAGDIPILLVGNKLDLEKSRVVPKEEGVLTAKKYNLSGCVEVSSKTGKNVEKVFDALISLMLGNEGYQIDQGEELLSMEDKDPLPDMRYSKNIKRDKGDIKFLEEKLDNSIDNVERMMAVILRTPDLVDQSLATVNQKLSILESQIKDLKKKRDEDDDVDFPYPYVFKPPEPPGDFAMAPQGKGSYPYPIFNSRFLNWSRGARWTCCPNCMKKFTKEKFNSHSCNIKPEDPATHRKSSMRLSGAKKRELKHLFSRRARSRKKSRSALDSQSRSTNRSTAIAGVSIDPQLKGEVQSFIEWIKDSEGLPGYINYYLQQDNITIISELSKIYAELRQIFGV